MYAIRSYYEFGFHDSLKLYSGGLGILAGDYLKEASDAKVNLVGVGLLYRYGYFSQVITTQGEQQADYDYQHFSKIPIEPVKDEDGNYATVQMMLPGRILYSRIWKLHVGRIVLRITSYNVCYTKLLRNQPDTLLIFIAKCLWNHEGNIHIAQGGKPPG